jgi:hypothetical protein
MVASSATISHTYYYLTHIDTRNFLAPNNSTTLQHHQRFFTIDAIL